MEVVLPDDRDHATFLALERQAAAPYDAFVYGSSAEADAARAALYERGTGEWAPPRGRLVIDGGRVVGVLACVRGSELGAWRLRSTRTLSALGLLADRSFAARLKVAAGALMKPQPLDYYLSRIAVAESARGRGIAQWMMQRFEADARELECRRLTLEVAAANTAARALYARCGFDEAASLTVTDQDSRRALTLVHMVKAVSRRNDVATDVARDVTCAAGSAR